MYSRPPSLSSSENRVLGIGVAMLLHASLLNAWQASRQRAPDDERQAVFTQWVQVPDSRPQPATRDVRVPAERRRATVAAPAARTGQAVASGIEQPSAKPDVAVSANGRDVTPVEGGARLSVEQALREAGVIERTLRKSSKAYIVAHRTARRSAWPAGLPKRRQSRRAAGGKRPRLLNSSMMAATARDARALSRLAASIASPSAPPATSIDMIEKFGKQSITNCGHEHEQPVNAQEWRTARD